MNGLDKLALKEWCEARKTDIAVGRAIFDLAGEYGLGDDEAHRIWESPTEEEIEDIRQRAWRIIDASGETYPWGDGPRWGEDKLFRILAD